MSEVYLVTYCYYYHYYYYWVTHRSFFECVIKQFIFKVRVRGLVGWLSSLSTIGKCTSIETDWWGSVMIVKTELKLKLCSVLDDFPVFHGGGGEVLFFMAAYRGSAFNWQAEEMYWSFISAIHLIHRQTGELSYEGNYKGVGDWMVGSMNDAFMYCIGIK